MKGLSGNVRRQIKKPLAYATGKGARTKHLSPVYQTGLRKTRGNQVEATKAEAQKLQGY